MNKRFLYFLIPALIVLLVFAGYRAKQSREEQQFLQEWAEFGGNIEKELPQHVQNQYTDEVLVRVTQETETKYAGEGKSDRTRYYNYLDRIEIEFSGNRDFRFLSAEDKCAVLRWIYQQADGAVSAIRKETPFLDAQVLKYGDVQVSKNITGYKKELYTVRAFAGSEEYLLSDELTAGKDHVRELSADRYFSYVHLEDRYKDAERIAKDDAARREKLKQKSSGGSSGSGSASGGSGSRKSGTGTAGKASGGSAGSGKTSGSGRYEYDPYDADDYDSAEEFADEKYQEFYDYEDDFEDHDEAYDAAEEYWNDRH